MFIQCLGPDDLLGQNFIKAMQDFLFSISVFNRETNVEDLKRCHPMIAICFLNISRYEDQNINDKMIKEYKASFINNAV